MWNQTNSRTLWHWSWPEYQRLSVLFSTPTNWKIWCDEEPCEFSSVNCLLSFKDTIFTFIWCHTLHGCCRRSDKHCVTKAWLRNNKREWGRVCPAPNPLRSWRKIASVSLGRRTRAARRELSGTHCQVFENRTREQQVQSYWYASKRWSILLDITVKAVPHQERHISDCTFFRGKFVMVNRFTLNVMWFL